jgi:hypothetical protein
LPNKELKDNFSPLNNIVNEIKDLGFDDVPEVDISHKFLRVLPPKSSISCSFFSNDASLSTCLFTKSSKGWLWYRRLAYVGMNQLKKLMKHDLVIALNNDIIFKKNKLCSVCQAGKQVGNTYPTKSVMSTLRPLELLHMDLFGPTTYRSIGGNSYDIVVVDDYSRYTWVFFLVTNQMCYPYSRALLREL